MTLCSIAHSVRVGGASADGRDTACGRATLSLRASEHPDLRRNDHRCANGTELRTENA